MFAGKLRCSSSALGPISRIPPRDAYHEAIRPTTGMRAGSALQQRNRPNLADVYAGHPYESNFVKYVVFVTYFPHLVAGPILHHREMMPLVLTQLCVVIAWVFFRAAAGARFSPSTQKNSSPARLTAAIPASTDS